MRLTANHTGWWAFGREIAMAFGVIALIFLGFGHQPLRVDTPDQGTYLGAGPVVFCGSGPAGVPAADKKGCEACRIAAGIALPEPPCTLGQKSTSLVIFADRAPSALNQHQILSALPRGPPALA
jgi:hypothetical protein